MESCQALHEYKKLSRIRVTIVGSHLFEATHYSLVGLLHEIEREVNIKVLAKHPMLHHESGTAAPRLLMIPRNQPWRPNTDIVHAVGGGETAIRVSGVLDPNIPMIVSFVGGADLSRQLRLVHLRVGYQRLFERASFVTYPDRFGLSQLEAFGVREPKCSVSPLRYPFTLMRLLVPAEKCWR